MKIVERQEIGPITLISTRTKRDIAVHGLYIQSFSPETQAALGASLSRDPSSITKRLNDVLLDQEKSERIMSTFFKQYGHNSIGDMGFFIMSIEGLSMKGAVHVVEHQLFNGQEASTRYLDFSQMGFLPVSTSVDRASKKCFELYSTLNDSLRGQFIKEGMSEKSAEPKAFDIAGAFLPLSARTNVFWVGSIRTYINQIRKLMSMDAECREIGAAMENILMEVCPNSVNQKGEDYFAQELNAINVIVGNTIFNAQMRNNPQILWSGFHTDGFLNGGIRNDAVNKDVDIVSLHGSELDALAVFGSITAVGNIDFRSARDIHRHRAFSFNRVAQYESAGVEQYYLDAIPDQGLRSEVETETNNLLHHRGDSVVRYKEYGLPMATKFPYIMSGPLTAWLNFLRLRSGQKVHPTVIEWTQRCGAQIEQMLHLNNLYRRGGTEYSARSKDRNNGV